jgi:hypothetical protein
MIEAIMSRVFVVFFFNGGAADICTATFFALTEVFFAFVAAGVAAVVLDAHFLKEMWEVVDDGLSVLKRGLVVVL